MINYFWKNLMLKLTFKETDSVSGKGHDLTGVNKRYNGMHISTCASFLHDK